MEIIKQTKSICPECLQLLDATIFERENVVYISKNCSIHGEFQDIYWSDYEQYLRAQSFPFVGNGLRNPRTETDLSCPFDCGICPEHKSHTVLSIIDVTNRCNLRCPVCFATAGTTGYVYEPSQDEIRKMLENLRQNDPVPTPALQFSGGEPTIREDLPSLIKIAKELGFRHVEVNTNGIRLAKSVAYCRQLVDAGMSTVYLQFDGVLSETFMRIRGLDLLDLKKKAIENCREAGVHSIVLVVTLIKGVNDNQLGDIIDFAIGNFDIVRCVNVQPVSFCGRIPEQERREMRITIPDFMKLVEEQTKGRIKVNDFYPVTTVVPVSRAIGALKGRNYVEFTAHPHCGMSTFVFIENGEIIPITKYVDVEKFVWTLEKVYEDLSEGHETRAKMRLMSTMRHIKLGLVRKYLWSVIKTGSYDALRELQKNILMISAMHFQDPYNFDLERVQRCVIHYAVPNGKIIPFCTMNSIHRPMIEKDYGIPIGDWEKLRRTEIYTPEK